MLFGLTNPGFAESSPAKITIAVNSSVTDVYFSPDGMLIKRFEVLFECGRQQERTRSVFNRLL